jgi:hypothetical protein
MTKERLNVSFKKGVNPIGTVVFLWVVNIEWDRIGDPTKLSQPS